MSFNKQTTANNKRIRDEFDTITSWIFESSVKLEPESEAAKEVVKEEKRQEKRHSPTRPEEQEQEQEQLMIDLTEESDNDSDDDDIPPLEPPKSEKSEKSESELSVDTALGDVGEVVEDMPPLQRLYFSPVNIFRLLEKANDIKDRDSFEAILEECRYKGKNADNLTCDGGDSHLFMTFSQAKATGSYVKGGSKSKKVRFFRQETATQDAGLMLFSVFDLTQINRSDNLNQKLRELLNKLQSF